MKNILVILLILIGSVSYAGFAKFTQLTTPNVTTKLLVDSNQDHSILVKVAGITTNVIVRLEGSVDGDNWANMNASDPAVDTTITTDGNYWLTRSNHPTKYIRFRFVSESGGTNATIDAWYGGL